MENYSGSNHHKHKVGDLVWVPREDRTWWPGQILRPDELPTSCNSTPGQGTPIKLLGSGNDANVGWYDLEEVRRFRYADYKFWIDQKKASAASKPSTTRDDAILKTLEIEVQVHPLGADPCANHQNTKHEECAHNLDLNLEYVSSEEKELDISDQVDSDKPVEEMSQKKKKPWRKRELDDLGVGGDVLLPSKRKRTLLPHVREFLKRETRRKRLNTVSTSAGASQDTTPLTAQVEDTINSDQNEIDLFHRGWLVRRRRIFISEDRH